MAKKRPKRGKPAKRKNELAKRDKAQDSEILETMTHNGKKVNIKKWHIRGIAIPPTCIVGSEQLNKELKATLELKFDAVKAALRSDSKTLQDEAIDTMLGDLVAGGHTRTSWSFINKCLQDTVKTV